MAEDTMRCRVLHLIPALDWGTAELQLQRLLPLVNSSDAAHHVRTLRGSPTADAASCRSLASLAAPRRFDLATCRRLREVVQAIQPNVIHAWRPECWWYAKFAAPSLPKIVSVWDHQWTPNWMQWAQHYDQFSRLGAPWCSGVDHRMGYLLPPPAVRESEANRASRLQSQLGIPLGHKLICVAAPLLQSSHLKDAIWAADLIKVIRNDVHLVIAGRGPLAGRLRRFREQVRIEDRVHFVEEYDLVEAAIAGADCLWAPGQGREGVGAMLEAMARNVPVIAADVSLHRQYVEPDNTGLLVTLGDRADLARQTLRMFESSTKCQQLAVAAAHTIYEDHDSFAIRDQYAQVYQQRATIRSAA